MVAAGPYNELLYYWASPTAGWSIASIAPAGSIVSAPAMAVGSSGEVCVVAQGPNSWMMYYNLATPGGQWIQEAVTAPQRRARCNRRELTGRHEAEAKRCIITGLS